MILSSSVQTAWSAYVWANSTIQAITKNALPFEYTEDSEKEVQGFYFNNEINFFTYIIQRSVEFGLTNKIIQKFTVNVNYYLEQDIDGSNWASARDAIETLYNIVDSSLGKTWKSNIDFWRPQEDPSEIDNIIIDGRKCWRANYKFLAEVITS